MRKRFRPTPEVDALTVLGIVDEITNSNRITAPSAAELAERRDADRERERRRRERQAAAEQAELEAEQIRLAEEAELDRQQQRAARVAVAEQAKAAMAAEQQRNQEAAERRRLSSLVQEWTGFKAGLQQMQAVQQREANFQEMKATINNLTKMFSPEPEPPPDYDPPGVPSPRMGDPNWSAEEMGRKALRWR
jgi:hypothetical protein